MSLSTPVVPPQAYVPPASTSGPPRKVFWKVFFVLMAASVVGSLAAIPYTLTAVKQMPGTQVPPNIPPDLFWTIAMAANGAFETALSAGAILLGLWLGRRVGLGAPDVEAMASGDPEAHVGRRARYGLLFGAATGIVVCLLILALKPLMPPPRAIVDPPAWQGFLVSIGAGIREELWLRLGVMTLLVWVLAKLAGRAGAAGSPAKAPAPLVWAGNVLAALLFGAAHLPQAAGFYTLTAGLIAVVLLLNGVAGVVFGWIYWKQGLIAAMVAHFSADVVLKVIAPLARSAITPS